MTYKDCIQPNQSLFEIYELLIGLPSPRKIFFWQLVKATGRSPITVRGWLNGHQLPAPASLKALSTLLQVDEETLFPDNPRASAQSLTSRYLSLPCSNLVYQEFMDLITEAASVTPDRVRRWIKRRKVPIVWRRHAISMALGIAPGILFPEDY